MVKITTEINRTRTEDLCAFCTEAIEIADLAIRVSVFLDMEWVYRKVHPNCFPEYAISIYEEHQADKKKETKRPRGRPSLELSNEQYRNRNNFSIQWSKDQQSILAVCALKDKDKMKRLFTRIGKRLTAADEESLGQPMLRVTIDKPVLDIIYGADPDFWNAAFFDYNLVTESPILAKDHFGDDVPPVTNPTWLGSKILAAVKTVYGEDAQ